MPTTNSAYGRGEHNNLCDEKEDDNNDDNNNKSNNDGAIKLINKKIKIVI